jgi:hypothetical protein
MTDPILIANMIFVLVSAVVWWLAIMSMMR